MGQPGSRSSFGAACAACVDCVHPQIRDPNHACPVLVVFCSLCGRPPCLLIAAALHRHGPQAGACDWVSSAVCPASTFHPASGTYLRKSASTLLGRTLAPLRLAPSYLPKASTTRHSNPTTLVSRVISCHSTIIASALPFCPLYFWPPIRLFDRYKSCLRALICFETIVSDSAEPVSVMSDFDTSRFHPPFVSEH